MFRALKIRSYVLASHGALMLALGLGFLYIRTDMSGGLFDVDDVGIAVVLAVAALVVSALADWIAALGEGMEHFRRFTFYLLGGLGFVLGGVFLLYSHYRTMAVLLFFAAAHALIFSVSVFAFRLGHLHRSLHRGGMYLAGTISLLFAAAMAALATRGDDRLGITVLGAYLCFMGARLLHQAWRLHGVLKHHPGARGSTLPGSTERKII